MKLVDYLPQIKKALVPIGVAAVLTVLGYVGITGEMTVKEALGYAVTSLLVWVVRNVSGKK